jgi:lipopolysaccharide/colanic/teichoic acid biosynthesis glycosyltransferase
MIDLNQQTQLVVIHKKDRPVNNDGRLLRAALRNEPLADIILNHIKKTININKTNFRDIFGSRDHKNNGAVVAIPWDWTDQTGQFKSYEVYYKEKLPVISKTANQPKQKQWLTISNGRFVTEIDSRRLRKILLLLHADVITVNISPKLQASCENARIASHNKLIGFRRLYNDSVQPAPIPDDWPHHLFIKKGVLNKVLNVDSLSQAFCELIERCSSNSLIVRSLDMGGTVFDLDTEDGLLGFIVARLNGSAKNHLHTNNNQRDIPNEKNIKISSGTRLFGKVLLGRNVSIGRDAIIIGPTIIGNNVKIEKRAVIRTSIIGPGVSLPSNCIVQNRVLINGLAKHRVTEQGTSRMHQNGNGRQETNQTAPVRNFHNNNFRTWPRFSYAGCFKRFADIAAALIVLLLFAPVLPVIVLVIKLTSPGPVFFIDLRQGLHGKVFNCLKFRTMLVGANEIQDKLRELNQMDGPQFKMTNDPRLSPVGKFMRDTYLDEVPQFLNVLLGQMSVIGPRPSPESENTLCPSWRDARLSVRPGITGLWQICRTRLSGRDFQEWIYFDIKYIRELSLKTDLWIFWQTAVKMIKNFAAWF